MKKPTDILDVNIKFFMGAFSTKARACINCYFAHEENVKLKDLIGVKRQSFLELHNIGKKTVSNIEEVLGELGLSLADEDNTERAAMDSRGDTHEIDAVNRQANVWAKIAEINAVIARVEGMKAANMVEFTYNENAFMVCQQQLEEIAGELKGVF